jgi:hypothetical protein
VAPPYPRNRKQGREKEKEYNWWYLTSLVVLCWRLCLHAVGPTTRSPHVEGLGDIVARLIKTAFVNVHDVLILFRSCFDPVDPASRYHSCCLTHSSQPKPDTDYIESAKHSPGSDHEKGQQLIDRVSNPSKFLYLRVNATWSVPSGSMKAPPTPISQTRARVVGQARTEQVFARVG